MKLQWRRILTRLGIGLAIVVAVLYAYVFFFGGPFFLIKRGFKDPVMWRAPAPLPDLTISMAPGMKLSYFGWEFEVPWNDLDPNKSKTIGKPPWQWQLIGFRSGMQIVFIRHPAHEWLKLLREHKVSEKELSALSKLLGVQASSSEYAFTRAALETTPDQLTPFTLRREGVRLAILLLFKSLQIGVLFHKSAIFMIDTTAFRGFQYGDPQGHQREIEDVLYADSGGVEFWFNPCPPKQEISQAEINRVIQTVRKVDVNAAHAAQ